MLPLFYLSALQWSHPWHSPNTYGLETSSPRESIIVGQPYSLRSLLRVDATLDEAALIAMLGHVAEARDGRRVLFPHYGAQSKQRVESALTGSRWVATDYQACFEGVDDPEWELQLSRRQRLQRREDRRRIARAGLHADIEPWDGFAGAEAPHLIANQAKRHDTPDHPELVRMRYDEWSRCAEVALHVIAVRRNAELLAVATALEWQQSLTVLEVGFVDDLVDRACAYFFAVSEAPVCYAAARGLARVYVGYTTADAKRRRGAQLEPCYFGAYEAA